MYEDNRKIEATGLLSQGTKSYVPQPIKYKLNNASKPAPDHVNYDKEARRQRRIQQQQLAMQQEQMDDAGKGGKVICTKYYEHGYLDDHIYAADSMLGDQLIQSHPEFVAWYWSWGIPFVNNVIHGKTKLSRFALWLGAPLCKAWAREMAYQIGKVDRGSMIGHIMMRVGIFCFNNSKYAKAEVCLK